MCNKLYEDVTVFTCIYVLMYVGQTILKKYFHVLLRAFPEDYMTSLVNINQLQLITLKECEVDLITSHATSVKANKAILDLMILHKGSHKDLLEFCSIMEAIIVDRKSIVEQLRNGKLRMYICMYVRMYVRTLCLC